MTVSTAKRVDQYVELNFQRFQPFESRLDTDASRINDVGDMIVVIHELGACRSKKV